MLTSRQEKLYEFLLTTREYISADDIVYCIPQYRCINNSRSARSMVQSDAFALKKAYADGILDRCVVGKNTIGYKIGTAKDIYENCLRSIKRHADGIRRAKEVLKMAGLDGQMYFDEDDDIGTMDVTRKE